MVLRRLTLHPNNLQVLAIALTVQCEYMLVKFQMSLYADYEVIRACRDLTTGSRPSYG